MSFVIDIPSIFTKQTQTPLRVNNTILTGNEHIKGSLYVNGSIILNEGKNDVSNIVYYDYLDISTILNVGNKLIVDNIDIIEELSSKQDNVIETTDLSANSITVIQLEPELSSNLTSRHYVDTQIDRMTTTINDGTLTIAKTNGLQEELDKKQNLTIDIDLCANSITVIQLEPELSNNLTSKHYVDTQLNTKQVKIQHNDLSISDISGLQNILDSKQPNITSNDLSINDISGLNTLLSGLQQNKQDNITSQTDISLDDLRVTGDLVVNGSFISNYFTGNDQKILVSTQLDISNNGTDPALKVSQLGTGDIVVFNAGGEGDSLLMDSYGNATIYKKLNVIGDVSMNDVSVVTLKVSELILLDDALSIEKIKDLQDELDGKQDNITSETDISLQDLRVTGDLVVDGSFNMNNLIFNDITVNNEILVSTQLDVSNEGTGPALRVSQLGSGDVAVFNAGEEGDSLLIDYSGNTTIYKKLNVIGDVSMNDVSVVTLKVSELILLDDALSIEKIKHLQGLLNGKQSNITSGTDISLQHLSISGDLSVTGSFISNYFTGNDEKILVSTQLDISNDGTDSALKVSQLGTGDVALFNAGEEGNSLLIDSYGNTTIYKKLNVIGDVSMNDVSMVTLDVSNLLLLDDALSISNINLLQVELNGKQDEITSGTDISLQDLRVNGDLDVTGSFISNYFTGNNQKILVSTQLDISNEDTDPALKVSQLGTGDIVVFNAGEEGDSLLMDSYGNTTIYKKLNVIGDVSMNDVSMVTLDVSNLLLLDDALSISNINLLQVALNGKQDEITSGTDISLDDLRVNGDLDVVGSFISNYFTGNDEKILVSTQLDISNDGTGPALKVSQLGTGDIVVFNSGQEGDSLLMDSYGNTTIYKKLNVIGDVSMNDVSMVTLDVSNLLLLDDALSISNIKDLQDTLNGKQDEITSGTDLSFGNIEVTKGIFNTVEISDIQGSGLQPLLIAGNNISIVGDTISVSGEKSGDGIFETTTLNPNDYFTEVSYNIILGQQTNPTNSKLYVKGTITADKLNLTSDKRLKDNIEDICGSLGILRQLHPKKYSKGSDVEIGFIANDVLDINDISFVVSKSETYHTLNYNSLFSLSMQCVKELDTEIEKLEMCHKELEQMFFSKLEIKKVSSNN